MAFTCEARHVKAVLEVPLDLAEGAWPKLASALWFFLAQARPDRPHDYLDTPLVTDTQTNMHKGRWTGATEGFISRLRGASRSMC